MNNHWLDEVKNALEVESNRDSGARFDRLKELGIIDEHGEVTGHIHRWNAFLVITAVMRPVSNATTIPEFECLKPVFGMPGSSTIAICRDSMIGYLREGKKVITATRDARLDLWREGPDVRLSAEGFIQTAATNGRGDNLGDLPVYQLSKSRV